MKERISKLQMADYKLQIEDLKREKFHFIIVSFLIFLVCQFEICQFVICNLIQ